MSVAILILFYFYDLQNYVSLDWGILKVLKLLPTNPTCGRRGETLNYVQKYCIDKILFKKIFTSLITNEH